MSDFRFQSIQIFTTKHSQFFFFCSLLDTMYMATHTIACACVHNGLHYANVCAGTTLLLCCNVCNDDDVSV